MKNLNFKKTLPVIAAAGAFAVFSLTGCSSGSSKPAGISASAAETAAAATEAAGETSEVTKVVVGTTGLYALQSFINEQGELDGAEPAVMREIDARLPQYEFEFSTMEFASILPSVDAGKVQIAATNLRRTEDREANYIHSREAYITSPYYIIVTSDNTDINGIEDLEGKKLGINEGSTQAGIMEEYISRTGANIELVYSSDPVPDLVSGRIAAVADPQRYVLSLNSSYEDAQFKAVGEPIDNLAPEGSIISDYNAYLWYAETDTELRDAVDVVLKEMYEDGTLGEISRKYYGEDYAKDINRIFVESFE